MPGYILNCPAMFGRDPNIEGSYSIQDDIGAMHPAAEIGGALYKGQTRLNAIQGTTVGGSFDLSIDASRCSIEYVNGATLQPSALKTLVCIKL